MMNKHIISLFALSAIVFSSCIKEQRIEFDFDSDGQMKYLSVGFREDTKCSESHGEEYLGETMVVSETGDTLYISAYLSDMDYQADEAAESETKSSLIGSGNFGYAEGYTSFSLNAYKDGDSKIYSSLDKSLKSTDMQAVSIKYDTVECKWKFGKEYFWPSDGKALNFCSYGPTSEFGEGGHASTISWNKDTKTFSFNYTTPSEDSDTLDAENQKDIIVGVNNQKFVKDGDNHIVLSLTHPMMAVRFVLGDIWGKIEYVSLENFNSEGTCNVTSDGFQWSDIKTKKTFAQTYDMFDATKYTDDEKGKGTVLLDTTYNKRRHFIIIPQVLPDDAAMGIKVGNNLHPLSLSFKKICDSTINKGLTMDWSGYAGKVLTFRVSSKKANLVSVDITDNCVGTVKDDIKIFNDGKSDLYIRAVLVGNWLNEDGDILAAWDEELPYGKFFKKNGSSYTEFNFPTELQTNWVYNKSDGFYYYTKILPTGYRLTYNPFEKFVLTDVPKTENESEDEKVKIKSFEMAILVQAVAAEDPGLESTYKEKYNAKMAWGLRDTFIRDTLLTTKDTGAKM